MTWLKQHYGPAEGPLGFPLTDKQAFALETILKALPRDSAFNYRKAVVDRGPTELACGERSDVSWISTEDPDRMGEVVAAKGMSDSQFRLNPIVTLNHCYDMPPVGKSLWRKFVKDGDLRGIKAKTQYPARPADWNDSKDWPADVAFTLVQADLLRGKSIGFLPVKVHTPTTSEVEEWARKTNHGEHGAHGDGPVSPVFPVVKLVIDEWILLEYACVFLPAQQNAVVESVSKALTIPDEFRKALGISNQLSVISDQLSVISDRPSVITHKGHSSLITDHPLPITGFTRLCEIEKAIQRQIEAIDIKAACRSRLGDRLDLLRGRI
jgi:hypothetical protein